MEKKVFNPLDWLDFDASAKPVSEGGQGEMGSGQLAICPCLNNVDKFY